MSSEDWVSHSYTDNQLLPRHGEIIRLTISLNDLAFKYGPSSHYAPSSQPSGSVSNSSAKSSNSKNRSKKTRKPKEGGSDQKTHFVLVFNRFHHKDTKQIDIDYFPIASYSSLPKGRPNDGTWDPKKWMQEEATELERMHYLPVPASTPDWTPIHPPDSPVLTFGNWKNTRPAWVLIAPNVMTISEDDKWDRHVNDPVVLDGDSPLLDLLNYHTRVLPKAIGTTSPVSIPNATYNTTVMRAIVPEFSVWTTIFPYGPYRTHHILNDDSTTEEEELSDEDEPILSWKFLSAPKGLPKSAEQHEKATLVDSVLKWQNQCVAEGVEMPTVEDDGSDWEGNQFAVFEDVDDPDSTLGEETRDDVGAEILE